MSLLHFQQIVKFRPKIVARRFRVGQTVNFISDIYSECVKTIKSGEIIYIHPEGFFITVEVNYPNGNKHKEAINWFDFNNVDIIIGNFWEV